jgi:hypothetical protein
MTVAQLQQLLDQVRDGRVAPEEALDHVMALLRASSYEDLGFARVDHDREWRQGSPADRLNCVADCRARPHAAGNARHGGGVRGGAGNRARRLL